jgi:acetolactate decarboxylase
MKSNRGLVAGGIVLGLVISGGVPEAQTPPSKVIRQNMPIVALQNGHFPPSISIGEAKAQGGDLGVGAMASLDGEVINVDGVIYQFGSDCVVRVPPDGARLSFSAMTRFRPSRPSAPLPAGTSLASLGPLLDPSLPSLNTFYAIRIEGTFSSVTSRTYPRQQEVNGRFPPLCKVMPKVFPVFKNVKGTIVGFRSPQYLSNLAIPSYHLHFLTADKKGGGHVLDFTVAQATVEIDRVDSLALDLPADEAFATMDLSKPITCSPPIPTPPPSACPPLHK